MVGLLTSTDFRPYNPVIIFSLLLWKSLERHCDTASTSRLWLLQKVSGNLYEPNASNKATRGAYLR